MTEKQATIPVPGPFMVSLVISDGIRFATVQVDRQELEANPADVIGAAMVGLDTCMARASQEDITDETELRRWRDADVVRTSRGWALSPAALEEVMRVNYGDSANGNDN